MLLVPQLTKKKIFVG